MVDWIEPMIIQMITVEETTDQAFEPHYRLKRKVFIFYNKTRVVVYGSDTFPASLLRFDPRLLKSRMGLTNQIFRLAESLQKPCLWWK